MNDPATGTAHGRIVLLAPQFFGSLDWYRVLAAADIAVIDTSIRYDKRRKSLHRASIADVRGRLDITVPVSRGNLSGVDRPLRWSDMVLSDHGHWWTTMRATIESAYGRTPYFEYFYDRISPFFSHDWVGRPVTEYDTAIDAVVRDVLGIRTPVSAMMPLGAPVADMDVIDMRGAIPAIGCEPYRQVRQDALGFIPGLSILDYIMNVGPVLPNPATI